jgi:hyperosmotically inducible periplasmic protein
MIIRKKYFGNNKNISSKEGKSIMKIIISFLVLIVIVTSLIIINASLFASVTDDRIEISAKKSYVFKFYLKGDGINVQSKDGVVTLTGTVFGESNKSLARETVASLPGVISVDNKLGVKGEVPGVYTDAWLIAKVKSTLWFHRSMNGTETEVLAKERIVTLRGEATSAAQKDLATEYAKDVEGVNNVINEMTVLPAAMKPGKKTMSEKMNSMSASIDDASITALVKTTLQNHHSTSALNTTVETKEGVVELGGKAGNTAEKDMATKLVSDVYAVKRVVNSMVVL